MTQKTWPRSFQSLYTVTGPDSNNVLHTDVVTGPRFNWTDSKAGVSVPGWKKIIRQGGNASSAYQVIAKTYSGTSGFSRVMVSQAFSGNFKDSQYSIEGNFAPYSEAGSYSGNEASRAINANLSAFLSLAKNKQTQFDGFTFVGELREAFHMFHGAHTRLNAQILAYLERLRGIKRAKSRKHLLKRVRDQYLEVSFGWQPTLNDVQDAAQAMGEIVTRNRELAPVAYKSIYSSPYGTVSENPSYTPSGSVIRFALISKSNIEVRMATVGSVKLAASGLPEVAQAFGFQFSDFVPALWELIPYSWAIDYFFNVGKVIEAYCWGLSNLAWNSRTIVQVESCTTTLTFSEVATKAAMTFNPKYLSGYGSTASSTVSRFSLNRGMVTSLPFLMVDMNLGPKKYANMAAVATQHRLTSTQLRSMRI
jgi:hypothetical protein